MIFRPPGFQHTRVWQLPAPRDAELLTNALLSARARLAVAGSVQLPFLGSLLTLAAETHTKERQNGKPAATFRDCSI
jgi:hypothetical protein